MEHQSDFDLHVNVRLARQRRGITLIKVVVCVGIIGLLIALLLPFTRSARGPARRNMCVNQLKQIAIGLQHYNDVYKSFPPAYTVDAEGKPLHSWRTLILPFLEEQSLYKSIDLSKAWDDPANAKAYGAMNLAYFCPEADIPASHTTYLAVVTPNGCFGLAEPRRLSEITDGHSKTLMVIEAPTDKSVHWMCPMDADEQVLMDFGPNAKLAHSGRVTCALFVDGHVATFTSDLPAAQLRAMISIAGNDEVTTEY